MTRQCLSPLAKATLEHARCRLGLVPVQKHHIWSEAEERMLIARYPNETTQALADEIGLSVYQVYAKAKRLGIAVFVQDSCTSCIARVKDLQAQKHSFDLYFVGSQGDDETIRRWAILAGIEPTSVRSRQITLNHDAGRWLGLGLGGELPAVVREVNGQWQRQ